ncbi:MAG: diaminopimelate epimerase [Mariprofundaceae bacterium]|nr:diaminopimelate epimerase [Mariprofundaceae bacterium]
MCIQRLKSNIGLKNTTLQLPFVKMQAQGNDFVILNALQHVLPSLDETSIRLLCHRHLGIGCDQLLILKPHPEADALLVIHNADASTAANCGNGLRCVADLLMRQLNKSQIHIGLADRTVLAQRTNLGVRINMGSANIEAEHADYMDIHLGNPHRVYQQNPQPCPQRNVEIIEKIEHDHIWIRIIERGAGETLACGSGACATATAIWQQQQHQRPLTIHMPGGEVFLSLDGESVCLEGSVNTVFSGFYDLTSDQYPNKSEKSSCII